MQPATQLEDSRQGHLDAAFARQITDHSSSGDISRAFASPSASHQPTIGELILQRAWELTVLHMSASASLTNAPASPRHSQLDEEAA